MSASEAGEVQAGEPQTDGSGERRRGIKDKVQHPFPELRQQLKQTHLYDAKIKASHLKHKVGKFGNLLNRNHRHDEEHEKKTDEKRTRICESHRFNSFAPERDDNLVKWYIDGRDYFWAVSIALERAKSVIYIADWWLSPELFLRRPPYYNQQWRLDQVLKRRAEAGVKIYVVVYREVEAALTCNSKHTKKALMNLCPNGSPGHGNIKVQRHPDHNPLENAADATFYWAHHEKFIVIDYELAFIGGLDLCYGRWDEKQHPLADVHPSGVQNVIFPGQDYNNNRILDFGNVEDWVSNALDKTVYGRMPWHDVAVGVIGPCVFDIAEHFVLRWNFVKRDKYKRDPRYDWITLDGLKREDEDLISVQRPKFPVGDFVQHPPTPIRQDHRGAVHAQIVRSSGDWSSGIWPQEQSIQNAYVELIRNAQHVVYIENQFFITATGEDQSPIHNQIGCAMVDACVRAGKEGRKFRIIVVIPAIPGFAGDLRANAAAGTRAIMDYQYKSICRGENSIFARIEAQGVDPHQHMFFFNLRSYDRLHVTPELREQEERSGVKYADLQRAVADEIAAPSDTGRTNRQAAVDKKRRFEDQRQDAGRGDQGGITDPDSIADDAMLNDKKPSKEPWEGEAEEEKEHFFQEELYVHGKVCIIDDRTVIVGSSNINDRSQLGFHDSELTIVMQDKDEIESVMNGESYLASRLAFELRTMLWREHLGLLPAQSLDASDDVNAQPPGDSPNQLYEGELDLVRDPLADALWDEWRGRATTNTDVFRDLFHVDPDDKIRTFDDYDAFTPNLKADKEHRQGHLYDKKRPVADVRAQLDRIQGHLVWMPLHFLEDAEMAEKGLQVNAYTESIYT